MTIDDFERLPDERAHYSELIDGELVDVSGNNAEHNLLRGLLARLLAVYADKRGMGTVISEQEYDFAGNAHGPDVTFFASSKRSLLNPKLRVQRFVPDLAIEIASPNDTFNSLLRKAQRYRQCGTAEVWIFSLEDRHAFLFSEDRRVILEESDDFRPAPIPGFAIRIGELLDRCR